MVCLEAFKRLFSYKISILIDFLNRAVFLDVDGTLHENLIAVSNSNNEEVNTRFVIIKFSGLVFAVDNFTLCKKSSCVHNSLVLIGLTYVYTANFGTISHLPNFFATFFQKK